MECHEFAPGMWLGTYQSFESVAMTRHNFKLVINCSPTYKFLAHLENSNMAISSDVIMVSLDPGFSTDNFSPDESERLMEYITRLNRVLQNYIGHFYGLNSRAHNLIHPMPNGRPFSMSSPVLSGSLKPHLFSLNRLIKLLRHVDDTIEVAIVSSENFNSVATGLAMSYLMDHYGLNYGASYNRLVARTDGVCPLNPSFYDDLLVIEAVRQFSTENNAIKHNSTVLTTHCKLKRKNDDDDLYSHKRRTGDDVLYVD
ncbi:hypothetical protein PGUG_03150 [Meyerozyma guilliermondii ATCC 6260]|uniref:Uncharacterized protein n=1 Tax=Meyerozyma guilliermondii (strain ATCC 6260 / CBS 566 / DSM 6381 / JCM 1539 / NBRC 10279 / NRRL Y-324) TaxID=294746 RepID=A5DIP9_PICGU|nr:uncharacterized protein PGUG_03150 [Meyerozyma guilliermondii ATCC 6260]EDK39052.2 hypothetical protein PGUG_03150 [Meyerozyma guilliermondii ATCC 6260]